MQDSGCVEGLMRRRGIDRAAGMMIEESD
jgi:hypothetical protein